MALLAVGPLPPPLTGTPISFRIFCDEMVRLGLVSDLIVVDASPKYLKQHNKKNARNFAATLIQAVRIVKDFTKKISSAECVILFGSNGYVLTMGPILLILAKIYKKKCYLRIFGGSLDLYCNDMGYLRRLYVMFFLGRYDGVILQTRLLVDHFKKKINAAKVHKIEGYRKKNHSGLIGHSDIGNQSSSDPLRIVFLGIVKEDKGVFVLLEALSQLCGKTACEYRCDIYGHIFEPVKDKFEEVIQKNEYTTYGGVMHWSNVVEELKNYDVLVLPSFYRGEGHPGVLIEAFIAGIPVIATNFRSIPEIVEHGTTGLLVEPESVESLMLAIERLCNDISLRNQLTKNVASANTRYFSDDIIPKFSDILLS